MKKIHFILLAILAVGLAFTACTEDTDNELAGQVRFEAFGPSPALRGSKLTFVGKNLDKITKVILPDNIEITDIEVISKDKIAVVIPQNATVGNIKLIAAGGKEFVSKTILSYTEPVSITSIAPSPIKAGQTLTITGDYLNLMSKVIFTDNIEVDEFITHERGKIEVVVPAEAQTGKIILADGATIPLELESTMELHVILPSVEQVQDLTNKKPGDVINIPGADLDLVTEVLLPSGESIPFTVADNVLSFTLPENVTDGAIVMVPASGVHIAVANIGIAIPSELTATPATGIKAGDEITIRGINMELVTTLTFPGVSTAVTPTSKSATEIKVTMPATAISGDLVLNTASGNTAAIAISTLKPELLAYNPNPVAAGNTVELQGRNLDLAVSVTFGEDKAVAVTPSAADKFTVTVPVDAESGKVILTMKNGETVECLALEVSKPAFCYIPVLPGNDVEINAGTVVVFDAKNTDKLTAIQVNGANVQFIIENEKLYVFIPANAGGNTTVKLISSNGEVEYTISVKGSGTKETVVYQGPVEISWSEDSRKVAIPASAFDNAGAGSKLRIYFTQMEAWGQVQINDGSWSQIPWPELSGSGTITTNTYDDKSVNMQEFILTQDILDLLDSKKGIFGAYSNTEPVSIIIQGSDWIINKVTVVTSAPSETVIMDTPAEITWDGDHALRIYKENLAGLSAGKKLVFYYTPSGGGDAQIKVMDAGWAGFAFDDPNYSSQYGSLTLDAAATSYEWPMTSEIVDKIMNTDDGWSTTGLIIMGQNCTLTKITIK